MSKRVGESGKRLDYTHFFNWFIGIFTYHHNHWRCFVSRIQRLGFMTYSICLIYIFFLLLLLLKFLYVIRLRSWNWKSHKYVINTYLSQWLSCYSRFKLISNRFRRWIQQQEQIKLIKKIPVIFFIHDA